MFSPEFLHYPGSHEFARDYPRGDYMALFSDSIMADREGERELARRKRQAQIERQLKAEKMQEAEPSFTPIFSAPVRTQHVDETAMRVLNTLGEFSHVERDLNDSSAQRHLLGIPKQPMTPLPSDGKSQGRLFPPGAGPNNKVCPNALNKIMQQNEMQGWRPAGQTKQAVNSDPRNDKPSANYTGSKQGNERQKTTSEKYKSNGTGAKGSNRGHAKSRTQKSSAADAKSGESHSGPPNGAVYSNTKVKKEAGAKYKPDSSRTEVDGSGTTKKPDSSNLFETVAKQPPKSMFDSDEEDFPSEQKPKKEKLKPRLDIPIKMEPNSSNQERKVESILSIMTAIKSPVTAIQTPIKDTSSKFQFGMVDKMKGITALAPIQVMSGGNTSKVKAVAPLDATTKSQRLPDAVTFQASDEDGGSDDEDVNKNRKETKESMTTTTNTIGKTTSFTDGELEGEPVSSNAGAMDRISDSSSDSSSSESGESGSEDSDSESDVSAQESPEEHEKVTTKPKYGLSKIIADVKNEKSPVTQNIPNKSHGDTFLQKTTTIKPEFKHDDNSSGFSNEMNFTSSKFSGNFDKYSDGNENNMDDFKKLNKESKLDKRTSMKKPAAKVAKGPKKLPVDKPTPSAKGASPQVKGDSKKEKTSKAKQSRQSGKTDSKPKNSAKSKTDKKSTPKSYEKKGKNYKSPKSKEFLPSDSSSDSEDDVPRINSKPNGKVKNKPNSVYSAPVSSVDDVFITISPPILSPLKSPDLSSDIMYNKSGIPSSLVVRFDLSDIDNLPGKVRTPHRTTCSPRSKRGEDFIDAMVDEKPPTSFVKGKRKSEEIESETFSNRNDSHKKPKTENISKSPRSLHVLSIKEEPQHNESVIPDSDTVLDRRRPYERRGSVTSVSSHHSSSGSSHKSDKDHPPSKKRKHSGTDIVETNLNNHSKPSVDWYQHDEGTDLSQTHLTTDTMCHKNPNPDKISAETDWVAFPTSHVGHMKRFLPDSRHRGGSYQDERQLTSDDYLNEGKKLKRLADAQADKNVKALTYFDAVLSFILCGHTMEINPDIHVEKAVTMYNETCEIIKFILKFKGTHQDAAYTDKKLQVLCHRCQALLYTRMFKLKKTAAMKMSRALGEHFKSQNKSQQGAQAPSPWNSTKYTGTPSPMSPTPSPAGSVGSCGSMGSQGSNNCSDLSSSHNYSMSQNKLTNGVTSAPMSSPAPAIQLPQRIMDMMSRFLVFSNYSLFGLDFWEQSEEMAKEHPEFFQELDQQCGPLTLHSSTLELVRYARNGLHRLKKS